MRRRYPQRCLGALDLVSVIFLSLPARITEAEPRTGAWTACYAAVNVAKRIVSRLLFHPHLLLTPVYAA